MRQHCMCLSPASHPCYLLTLRVEFILAPRKHILACAYGAVIVNSLKVGASTLTSYTRFLAPTTKAWSIEKTGWYDRYFASTLKKLKTLSLLKQKCIDNCLNHIPSHWDKTPNIHKLKEEGLVFASQFSEDSLHGQPAPTAPTQEVWWEDP